MAAELQLPNSRDKGLEQGRMLYCSDDLITRHIMAGQGQEQGQGHCRGARQDDSGEHAIT